jgi:hypothetical protein
VVVDARVAEDLRGDPVLRVEAALLRIEPESRDVQALEALGASGIRLPLDVDEPMRPVGELLVDLFRRQPQDTRNHRGRLRRVLNLQWIGIDGDRLLADSELDAGAVEDRAAVGCKVDRRAVLARGHPA